MFQLLIIRRMSLDLAKMKNTDIIPRMIKDCFGGLQLHKIIFNLRYALGPQRVKQIVIKFFLDISGG